MPRSRIARLAGPALLAVALATASPAAAASGPSSKTDARLLSVYQNTGVIPPCEFTIAELSHALHDIDTFDAVYFADFPNAIKGALDVRGAGGCASAGHTGLATVPVPAGGPGNSATAVLPNISVTAATGAPLPLPILLLALLAVAFGLAAAAAFLVRSQGWDPAWAATWRHSFSEAGYRLGGVWAEFTDWLRSGSEPPGRS